MSNEFTLESVRRTLGVEAAKRIAKWIALSILDDCNARLVVSRSGELARPPLAPIYVDLGIQRAAGDRDTSSAPFFEALVRKSDRELNRLFFGNVAAKLATVPRNWVLFGGPGQGKSTLTQWAALSYGWSVLEQDKHTKHTKLTGLGINRHSATALVSRFEEIASRIARVPGTQPAAALAIRVELPLLVEFLSAKALPPSFDALTMYLASKHDVETYASEWATLIRKHRCLFLFDALDEVTTPAARAVCVGVIDKTREAAGESARMIVTSRPQGYDGVLGPDCVDASQRNADPVQSDSNGSGFLQLHVAPLSDEQVTEFVRNVLAQQTALPQRDKTNIQTAITSALQRVNTRALLRAPLFVSIMLPLVDKSGNVPANRTKLLDSLYDILCDRESTKDATGRFRALLDDYRWALDALHARVALVLHVRSQERGARTSVTIDELRSIAETVVSERIDLLKIRTQIVEDLLFFARDRLVLLAQHEAETVRFDVRLVQEYFAARALFEPVVAPELRTTPSLRKERLKAIVTDSYWQQVLAFAVDGFASGNDREMFETLADTLSAASDGKSPIASREMQVARRGAQVALALIESGALSAAPNERMRFWTIAASGDVRDWRGSEWAYSSVAAALGSDKPDLLDHFVSVCEQAWRDRREWVALRIVEALGVVQANERARRFVDGVMEQDSEARRVVAVFNRVASENVPMKIRRLCAQRAHAIHTKFPEDFDPLSVDDPHQDEPPTTDERLLWHSIFLANHRTTNVRHGAHFAIQFLALGEPGPWRQLRATISSSEPHWKATAYVADFCSHPSPASFALSVHQLLGVVSLNDQRRRYFPWLIAAVLRRIQRGEDKADVVASIEAGELGDAAVWASVESSPLIREKDLWLHENASALLLEGSSYFLRKTSGKWAADFWAREGKQLREKLEQRSRFAAALFAWSVRTVEPDKLNTPPFDLELVRWMLSVGALSAATLPSVLPEPEAAARFLALLEERVVHQLLDVRCLAPTTDHDGWVLRSLKWFLKAAQTRLETVVTAALATLVTAHDVPTSLIHELHELPRVTGAEFAWARIQLVASSSEGSAIRQALEILSQRSDLAALHRKAIARRWKRDISIASPHRIALALRLWDVTPEDEHETRDAIVDLIRRHTISLPGAMASVHTRRSCGLPLVEPAARVVEGSASDGIVTLSAVQLSSIRCIESMQFDPAPPKSSDRGQWVVLLGDNGVGKTSMLRAIALSILKPSWVPRTAEIAASKLVRRDTAASSCRLVLHVDGASRECGCDFSVTDGREEAWNPTGENGRPFVVAYGANRSSVEDERGAVSTVHEPQAIHSLLYPNVRVVSPRAWVNTLGEQDGHVLSSVREALEGALRPAGVDQVRISTNEAFTFSGPSVGQNTPMTLLSDGYLSTIGWIVDVMARWVAACKRLERPLAHNFQREMTGVVLVDEIDQHLHPRWQRELIETIRQVFPKLTFVVTTHNPLTALELEDGELFGLTRDENNTVQIRSLPSMKGRRVDDVLTGPWFGLGSTLDDDTLALMQEHRELLRDDENEPRQREIEEQLRERMGRYAELSIERLALGVAQEIMDEQRERWKRPEQTPLAQREGLRSTLIERVKARLAERASESKGE